MPSGQPFVKVVVYPAFARRIFTRFQHLILASHLQGLAISVASCFSKTRIHSG